MEQSDSDLFPLNLYLSNNEEDTVEILMIASVSVNKIICIIEQRICIHLIKS